MLLEVRVVFFQKAQQFRENLILTALLSQEKKMKKWLNKIP